MGEDREEENRLRREPAADGKYYDDPLWYGKTKDQIRYAFDLEKANGNAAGRDGDWKRANRYWKNALKGAEKLADHEEEFRLHLNLALGYTKLHKIPKSLEHCDSAFREELRSAASPALRAKAHFRRAVAHAEAGDITKSLTSLRCVLDLEPANVDARKKWSELRKMQLEQRERERAFFKGKFPASTVSSASAANTVDPRDSDAEEEKFEEESESSLDSAEMKRMSEVVSSLTDHRAAAQLRGRLTNPCPFNMEVGEQMEFLGPLSPRSSSGSDHDETAPDG